jgi:hypothetical protein
MAAAMAGAKKRMKDDKGEDGSYDDSFIDDNGNSDKGKEEVSREEERSSTGCHRTTRTRYLGFPPEK